MPGWEGGGECPLPSWFETVATFGHGTAQLQDWDPVGGDYEPEEMELDPPKVLGDLLESLMGAIFIDSGMDLEAVWRVFIKVFRDKIGIAVPRWVHDDCYSH